MREDDDDLTLALMRDWLGSLREQRVLYHYTSAAGMVGILRSGVLRGTSAGFLNDTTEIEYGRSICQTVLEELSREPADDVERAVVEQALGWLKDDDEPPFEVYITSFSEQRDLLSQWRAYGSSAGRYCLGFQAAQFSERDLLRRPQKVEYEPASQHEKVRRAVAVTAAFVRRNPDDRVRLTRAGITLSMQLRRLMCTFKHPGFHEEREWRCVASVRYDELSTADIDVVDGIARPYIAMLHGSSSSERLPLVEVQVGYSPKPRQARYGAALLLRQLGYVDATLSESQIPFAP